MPWIGHIVILVLAAVAGGITLYLNGEPWLAVLAFGLTWCVLMVAIGLFLPLTLYWQQKRGH